MNEKVDWYQFQEQICSHFRSIGAVAETNVTVKGVRTSHDIDILVQTKFLGDDLVWIVEAKKWKVKVKKLHVLGLRTIVEDIGADRGYLISEAGFQRGAYEAAKNTTVKLKTFSELKADTKEFVEGEILKTYKKRIKLLEARYWAHTKQVRMKYKLRPDFFDSIDNSFRYSGHNVLSTAGSAIVLAERNGYPINLETLQLEKTGELVAENFQQLINWLNLNLNLLDERILNAEVEMIKNGDFDPRVDEEMGWPDDMRAMYFEKLAEARSHFQRNKSNQT